MKLEEDVFANVSFDFSKLEAFGFQKETKGYHYTKKIMNDTFQINILISFDQKVTGHIYDLEMHEEYQNFRISSMNGSFVRKIRNEYCHLLEQIKKSCTNYSLQIDRIMSWIYETYQDKPHHEWEKFPLYSTFKKNEKWYALFMNVNRQKLGQNKEEEIYIVNVKLPPKKIEQLVNQNGFCPSYHMNKKHWITILLDDSLKDEEIISLIKESYQMLK